MPCLERKITMITTAAIIGLGLMGGSFAKALTQRTGIRVYGEDTDPGTMAAALETGAIHAALTPQLLRQCDLTVLALYPDDAVQWMQSRRSQIKKGSVVVDFCGVKQPVCQAAEPIAREEGFFFIGGHPMAGKECWGFSYAVGDLYEGASMILTPPPEWKEQADALRPLFFSLGFGQLVDTTPENHDRMIAYTSQLAHVASSAFIKSPSSRQHVGYSAGSYKDLTRVAKLNPNMWTKLFLANGDYLCEEIDLLIEHLAQYRDAIAAGDKEKLYRLLKEGSDIKQSIG